MKTARIIDIAFILLSFGLYILLLNIDPDIANTNILSRHIWIPLVAAYFTGRVVSGLNSEKED